MLLFGINSFDCPCSDAVYLRYLNPDGGQVILYDNESAINPTLQEVVDFIKNDNTDHIQYNIDSFVCSNYAQVVHNNAEAMGYKTGWVAIAFSDDDVMHSCNAFNTSDCGVVYIDCTGSSAEYATISYDTVVFLDIGQPYIPQGLYENNTYTTLGTLESFTVYW
jgi:hypothetical protein